MGRLEGVLALSRAFGDCNLKKNVKYRKKNKKFKQQGLICTPFINTIELRLIHKYLILASDGVWDVIKDEYIVDILKGKGNSKEIAEEIMKVALSLGSTDNISVLVLKLN